MLYLMLIYQDEAKMAAASPEEQEAIGKGYGELNALLQRGAGRGTATWPPNITTVRVRGGDTQRSEGAYQKDGVAGFFLIEAEDLDGAVELASRVPGARYGAVEIRPVQAQS
jgi:hypothetical protein